MDAKLVSSVKFSTEGREGNEVESNAGGTEESEGNEEESKFEDENDDEDEDEFVMIKRWT